jgi:hypothetical protein
MTISDRVLSTIAPAYRELLSHIASVEIELTQFNARLVALEVPGSGGSRQFPSINPVRDL